MSTIKSSADHLTLSSDGSGKEVKFQIDGVEKASISSSGAFTSTSIDATKLTGALPAISGANLTGVGVAGISSSADATAITITSAEKIGINETAPFTRLHVKEGDSGATDVWGDTGIVIENSADARLSLLSGSSDIGSIKFGDSGLNRSGGIDYNHNGDVMTFATQNTERMRIGGDGLITNSSGMYKTPPTSTTATSWNFDSSGATISCTQNTAIKIGDCGASGMLIINDTTLNGQINILLTGAGAFTFLGASSHWVNSSSPSTSQVGFYRSGSQIYVKNGKSATVQLGLMTFRTRSAQ